MSYKAILRKYQADIVAIVAVLQLVPEIGVQALEKPVFWMQAYRMSLFEREAQDNLSFPQLTLWFCC